MATKAELEVAVTEYQAEVNRSKRVVFAMGDAFRKIVTEHDPLMELPLDDEDLAWLVDLFDEEIVDASIIDEVSEEAVEDAGLGGPWETEDDKLDYITLLDGIRDAVKDLDSVEGSPQVNGFVVKQIIDERDYLVLERIQLLSRIDKLEREKADG